MISAVEWILPDYGTHLHDPVTSFRSEFGAKLALLGPIEFSVLFANLHKRISLCNSITKYIVAQLVKFPKYIGFKS